MKITTELLERQAPKRVESIENFISKLCKSLNFDIVMTNYEIESDCEFINIELVSKYASCDSYLNIRIENKKLVLFENDYNLNSDELSGYNAYDKFNDYYSMILELKKLIDFITE